MNSRIRPGAGLCGVLVVDKPAGPTSAHVVATVKRVLGGPKIGHTGTLDPMATGVLPLVLGEATKIATWLLAEDKEYLGEFELGRETDTLDAQGAETARTDAAHVTLEELRLAAKRFVGELEQVPPAYSALHVAGKRAHELARAGKSVELAPRRVVVNALEILGLDLGRAHFRVAATKGFYVRSLVRDLGRALNVGANMTMLRRTRTGQFDLSMAVPLVDVAPGVCLIEPGAALPHLPQVKLTTAALVDLRQGKSVVVEPAAHACAKAVGPDGTLVALGEILAHRFQPRRVLIR